MSKSSMFKELSDEKYSPLSREEERELIRRAKEENDKAAEKRIVESNLRYVAKMASKYASPGSDKYWELVNSGTIGLYKALEKFDPERGTRFLTFATLYIFHEMYQLLTFDLTILSMQSTHKRLIVNLYRLVPDLEKELGRFPEVDEVIEALRKKYPKLKVQEDFIRDILNKRHLPVSIEEMEGGEEKNDLAAFT